MLWVQMKFQALAQSTQICIVNSISFPNMKIPNLKQNLSTSKATSPFQIHNLCCYCHLFSKSTTYVVSLSSFNAHLSQCLDLCFLSKRKGQKCLCCFAPHFLDLNKYNQIFVTRLPPLVWLLSSKSGSICQELRLLLVEANVKILTSTHEHCKKEPTRPQCNKKVYTQWVFAPHKTQDSRSSWFDLGFRKKNIFNLALFSFLVGLS